MVKGEYFSNNIDATRMLRHDRKGREAVGEVDIEPGEQVKVFLGEFATEPPLKGFSVEFSPGPVPEGSVVTLLTDIGSSKTHRFYLHAANTGIKKVTLTVRKI